MSVSDFLPLLGVVLAMVALQVVAAGVLAWLDE